jgi:BMFP domain-containing protein YqiC
LTETIEGAHCGALFRFGVSRMQNDYYAALEKQLKAFITVGFGELAAAIKRDFERDRAMIEQLRERISELEERFTMVNGHQAGRGVDTP